MSGMFFLDSLKNNHYSSFIKMKSKSLTMPKNFKIKERSYPSFDEKRNDCYAANDEIYPIRLAA